MIQDNHSSILHKRMIRFAILLLAFMAITDVALAQRTGGFGGFGGGGNSSTANRREYFSNTMVGDAMISADTETRRIIVITDDETNMHISQVITNLDRPRPQVLIKVVFVEVEHRDNKDIGIDGMFDHTFGNGTTSGALATDFGGLGTLATGGTYTLLAGDFEATLRAIAEKGRTEVLSRPSILTRNNQEAVITIGEEVPFITGSQVTQLGQTINTITYDDVGIILRVTPFISDDGHVEMIVAPEISSIGERTVAISPDVNAPVIKKRSAETVVVTEHGQTVVIGGLMQNNKIQTTRKVPVLGDIPLLGFAFRRKITEDVKTELLIFLTPFIVNHASELASLTNSEAKESNLMPGTFEQRDIDRFINGVEVEAAPEPKSGLKGRSSGK